jgi:hypothetical protein
MATTTQDPQSVGVFDELQSAQRTIDELRQHGFAADEIGIIGHVGDQGQPVAAPASMKAPERNVMRGAGAGGLFGAVIGTLVLLVIPGLGAVTGAGYWFEIAGGAILGAAAGAILMAFGSLLFSSARSRLYKSDLEKGRFIVTVKNPQRRGEALAVLGREAVHAEAD